MLFLLVKNGGQARRVILNFKGYKLFTFEMLLLELSKNQVFLSTFLQKLEIPQLFVFPNNLSFSPS